MAFPVSLCRVLHGCTRIVVRVAVALVVAHAAMADAEKPRYDLNVAFDVSRAKITGTATIDSARGTQLSIYRGELHILDLTNGGRNVALGPQDSEPLTLRAEGIVRIRYEGTFTDPEGDVIGKDTILLRGMWYPVVEGTYRFQVTATLPRGFEAVSEADRVRRTDAGGLSTFVFDLPYPQLDWHGVTLIASRQWVSHRTRYRDIDLSVYVLPRNARRLDELTQQAERQLQRLEGLLGAYPFKRLAIVENPVLLSYSVSMPTYVLLTPESVSAEATEDSSLDHEIAHEWFANGVLADYDGGNWAEGLASYFSDLLEVERSGAGWERRQRMMAGYQNNVADRAASPLSKFTESSDRISRLIGYGKSALVVHMLRRQLGDEQFFAAMRRFVAENLFRVASWSDLRRTFEQTSETDLGWFFAQWVDGVVTPELALDAVSVTPVGDKHELRFTVTQTPPAFVLTVPVAFYFGHGESETTSVRISAERHEFCYLLDEKPTRVVLDEGYDVFRRLAPAEVPPRIDTLLTRQRVTLFAPPGEALKFGALIEAFDLEGLPITRYGWIDEPARKEWALNTARVRPPPWAQASTAREWRQLQTQREVAGAAAMEMASGSLILLGDNHPLIATLFGRIDLPRGGFTITVLKHPRSPSDVVAIVTAVSKAEVDAAFAQLFDRRRYSTAVFDDGKLISYEIRPGQRGITSEVETEQR